MTKAPPRHRAPLQSPGFSGFLADDAAVLAEFAGAQERLLASLAPKPQRDPAQTSVAEEVFARTRAARREFLALHTDDVYDVLTEHRTRHLRLPDLVRAAARRFPGLVPDEEMMAAESAVVQAHKEGREIDQGIFCAAVLGSPVAGPHLVDAMLLPVARSLDLADRFRAIGRVELDSVLVELRGAAAHVTFRNGHALNAEDNRLIADLETAVDLVLLDDRVRVGVLRGGPVDHPRYRDRRVFSAGINLKELRNGHISFVDFLLGRELGYLHKMQRGLLTAPEHRTWSDRTVQKPWIGAVETFAIGGGMQLLLVLDRVIAESGAFLSLPAAEEGIVPGLGNLRLTRATGARLARRIILDGHRVTVPSSEADTLVDEVVPSGEMDAAIDRAVDRLSAPAVAANRRMLTLAEEPPDAFRTYLAEFAVTQVVRAYSPDVLEKVERRWQRSREAHAEQRR
ncbi:(3,5-dihydroxyphenyl)acetyl-CoA 1,2-dioxygenase DpgC [Streptomyces sp. NPDC001852]|uniref:(3,5-dihydroxyphenyl)acetyl-CoA 1,2-dioxygenase DpgC n=1 Tax=Streptomyces sp. NPDC001852 TaxID=3364619 RepID=UPI0036D19338